MTRFASLLTIAAACAGCLHERYDGDPLSGDWRVERTVRTATADCPRLSLATLSMTLMPGAPQEIDLGPRGYDGGANHIAVDHVIFTTSEFAYADTSDMLLIMHDLVTQRGDARLLGTASAQGDGPWLQCHWDMDAIATPLPR